MKAYKVKIDFDNSDQAFQDYVEWGGIELPSALVVFALSEGGATTKFHDVFWNTLGERIPHGEATELTPEDMGKCELYGWDEDLHDVDSESTPINYYEYLEKHGEDSYIEFHS